MIISATTRYREDWAIITNYWASQGEQQTTIEKFHKNNRKLSGKGIDKVGEVCNIMVKSGKKW